MATKSTRRRNPASTERRTRSRGGRIEVILTTFASAAGARRIGRALVEGRLAACATVLPGARSIYEWKGRLEEAREVVVLLKTTPAVAPRLVRRLRALHPYDTPEVLRLTTASGNPAYEAWLRQHVR